MVLENEKVRSEKLYCVGYLKNLGKYILSQTVPASAWYNRYYEITKEQYDSFGSESLDEFANECLYLKHEDKFLFSDLISENNDYNKSLRLKAKLQLLTKLNEAKVSIKDEGTISADDLEQELEL